MTVSENIRSLAKQGLKTAEIARKLGIRYQHAYNVLSRATQTAFSGAKAAKKSPPTSASKPPLSTELLITAGFKPCAKWVLSASGELTTDQPLPKEVGVYAFAKKGVVMYVGVATMGLKKRLYFYAKPGITQRTSKRLNQVLKSELKAIPSIEIYAASPDDLHWNGLPVHASAGLELGLIKKYELPWNMRSAGK